ncbi:hypothetical protein D3C72_1822520 [compost metagenome]
MKNNAASARLNTNPHKNGFRRIFFSRRSSRKSACKSSKKTSRWSAFSAVCIRPNVILLTKRLTVTASQSENWSSRLLLLRRKIAPTTVNTMAVTKPALTRIIQRFTLPSIVTMSTARISSATNDANPIAYRTT